MNPRLLVAVGALVVVGAGGYGLYTVGMNRGMQMGAAATWSGCMCAPRSIA